MQYRLTDFSVVVICTVEPCLTDTSLLSTVVYVSFKSKPLHFFPLSFLINEVWLYKISHLSIARFRYFKLLRLAILFGKTQKGGLLNSYIRGGSALPEKVPIAFASVSPFGPFYRAKWQISLPFYIPQFSRISSHTLMSVFPRIIAYKHALSLWKGWKNHEEIPFPLLEIFSRPFPQTNSMFTGYRISAHP